MDASKKGMGIPDKTKDQRPKPYGKGNKTLKEQEGSGKFIPGRRVLRC